jgi:adenylate cyclase
VLFCDLRGFTALSESMKDDPEALTALVNRAMTPIANAILECGGAIDKFIGDCVMGLWNAPLDTPDHARRAIDAALAMVRSVRRLDARIARERAAAGLPPIAIGCGVGINTGECVVGNMGTATRFDYTAIGDAVNLAARLEGRTALYGLAVLVGEETARETGGDGLVAIDRVAVKGRAAPVELYTPASTLYGDEDPFRAAELQDAALAAYRSRAWGRAAEGWRELAAIAPGSARYAMLMAGRAERFSRDPPAPDWSGEWRFDEK